MKKTKIILTLSSLLLICAISLSLCGCSLSLPKKRPSDFSFSIRFGTFGESSYDSETGVLIKANSYSDTEKYSTVCILSEAETEEIYQLLRELDIEKYDEEFEPWHFDASDPYMTLSLTVRCGGIEKTVTANEVAGYDAANTPSAKKFSDTVYAIRKILIETDEWKALPEYEYLYD